MAEQPKSRPFTLLFALVGTVGIVAVLQPFLFSSSGSSTDTQTSSTDTSERVSVPTGGEGYLRVPGDSKLVCLGQTQDDFKQVIKSLSNSDFLGLLEIPGAFCVGQGTKVQVLDKSLSMTQVRITATYREVDDDKFGMSGWTDTTWVSGQ